MVALAATTLQAADTRATDLLILRCCIALSARFRTELSPARLEGFPRPFDLVSEDHTLVGNVLRPWRRPTDRLSSTQRSAISEQVLTLTSAPAQQRLLVFTQTPERILEWLDIFGHLAGDIEFWHLRGPGDLSRVA